MLYYIIVKFRKMKNVLIFFIGGWGGSKISPWAPTEPGPAMPWRHTCCLPFCETDRLLIPSVVTHTHTAYVLLTLKASYVYYFLPNLKSQNVKFTICWHNARVLGWFPWCCYVVGM